MTNNMNPELPAEYTDESRLFTKQADAICDEINDWAYDMLDTIPEFRALVPDGLEDEDDERVRERIVDRIETLLYKALIKRIG